MMGFTIIFTEYGGLKSLHNLEHLLRQHLLYHYKYSHNTMFYISKCPIEKSPKIHFINVLYTVNQVYLAAIKFSGFTTFRVIIEVNSTPNLVDLQYALFTGYGRT